MHEPSLVLIVLTTAEPERVKEFYERLGLRFQAERHGNGPKHFSAEIGQTVLEIYPLHNSDGKGDFSTRLGFRVHEPESVVERLMAAGALVVTPTTKTAWGFRTAYVIPMAGPSSSTGISGDARSPCGRRETF